MKIPTSKTLLRSAILLAACLSAQTSTVYASPPAPDNAALVYYQLCLSYKEPDDPLGEMIADVAAGKREPNEMVREFVGFPNNKYIIDGLTKAGNIPDCDWGLDYELGYDMQLPQLGCGRKLGRLVLADARILTITGDYRKALDRCLTVRKLARHVGRDFLLAFLVNVAINKQADGGLQDILGQMPADLDTLLWLEKELTALDEESVDKAGYVDGEKLFWPKPETMREEQNRAKFIQAFSTENLSPLQTLGLERIKSGDTNFFESNYNYMENIMAKVKAALILPYPQAYAQLKLLDEQPAQEVQQNPAATFAALGSAIVYRKMCSFDAARRAFDDAVRIAVAIYIIKAKTGELPSTLPAGAPKDPFSGQDFEYSKTAQGFTLRCPGRDLYKNEIHQYDFKVAPAKR
jgi:hypothetical protein